MVLLIKQTRMKQTAVDWLFNEYIDRGLITIEAIKQAIAMEKEQMCQFISDYIDDGQDMTAEQYYNETFGGNNGK
jgi:hypothetical protein